jgi:hypothetical protein
LKKAIKAFKKNFVIDVVKPGNKIQIQIKSCSNLVQSRFSEFWPGLMVGWVMMIE